MKRFPWGRFWLILAALGAVVLGTGFVLRYLGII